MWFGSDDGDARQISWFRALLARRMHSRWLTQAIRAGSKVPRIPVRRVDEGGFDREMATPEGREWASAWWDEALSRPDLR